MRKNFYGYIEWDDNERALFNEDNNGNEAFTHIFKLTPKFSVSALSGSKLHDIALEFFDILRRFSRFSIVSIPEFKSLDELNNNLIDNINERNKQIIEMELADRPSVLTTNEYYFYLHITDKNSQELLYINNSFEFYEFNKLCEPEVYKVIQNTFYPNQFTTDFLTDFEDMENAINKTGIKFKDGYYLKNDMYGTILNVIDVNISQNFNWLINFFNGEDYVSKIDMEIISTDAAKKIVNRVVEKNKKWKAMTTLDSDEAESEQNLRNARELNDQLTNNENQIYKIDLRIQLEASSLEELKEKVLDLKSRYRKMNLNTGLELEKTKLARLLPIHYNIQNFKKPMPLSAISSGMPVVYKALNDGKRGALLGNNKFGYVILDKWKVTKDRTNFSKVYIGNLGSGKSVSIKAEICHELSFNDSLVRVIPPSKEYLKLCNFVGGTYLDFKEQTINLLEINTTYSLQIAFITTLLTYLNPDINIYVLNRAIEYLEYAYKKHGIDSTYKAGTISSRDFPILSDFLSCIEEIENEDVIKGRTEDEKNISIQAKLSLQFLANGSIGKRLNGKTSVPFNTEDKFIVFDITEIEDERTSEVMYLLVCNFMRKEMYDNRNTDTKLTFVVEELHKILKSSSGMKFIDDIFFEARKYKTALTLSMHNLEQVIATSDYVIQERKDNRLEGLFKQIPIKVIFKQEIEQIDAVKKFLNISNDLAYQIPELEKGNGFLLLNSEAYRIDRHYSEEIIKMFDGGQ